MKKHYATHVEDTDKLISVAGPILEYETWYEQYKKLMEEQAQRKYGLYTPTSEGGDDFDPSSFDQAWTVVGKTNEDEDRATILWDSEELHEILNSEEWTIKENLNYDI